MKKKILAILFIFVMAISILNDIYASEGLFNIGSFETAYKLSKEADIDLPFINVFTKSATYDKDVNHSGISFGASTIDVDKKLEGVHLLISTQDMITIKGEVEHGIIYGTNVVIEGKITGDTILIADNVKVLEGAIIEKDVIIVASNLEMNGTVKGNLIGEVTASIIKGTIDKDLRINAVKLNLEEGIVNGDIYIKVVSGNTKDIVGVTDKYPNAIIKEIEQTSTKKLDGEKIASIILNGIKVVTIYTLIGFLLTRKENNLVTKMAARFTENTPFGVLTGTAMLMLVVVIPILLIILGVLGLGVIAWPVLVAYLGIILLSFSISSFVVGITIYQIIKEKLGKFKIPVLALIFAIIFALTQITAISFHVYSVINIMSMAVIMTYIFKRNKIEMKDNSEVKATKSKKKK